MLLLYAYKYCSDCFALCDAQISSTVTKSAAAVANVGLKRLTARNVA